MIRGIDTLSGNTQNSSAAEWHKPPRSWNRHKYAFLLATRHHKMLIDDGRLSAFAKAILDTVDSGDIVADLGAGTGVLSMIAAQKAKRVYAVELFPYLYEFGKEAASRYGLADKITFIQKDARTVVLPEKVDVIICEMVHTGCISEHQVPVMNHALETILKPEGRVIPTSITTLAQIISTNYTFGDFEFKLPHYESPFEKPCEVPLSPVRTLKTFDLTQKNPLSVSGKITAPIIREGIMNSLKITSEVYITKTNVLTEDDMTSSLEPVIFPLDECKVGLGDQSEIEYFYEPGAGAEGFHYDVIIR